MTDTIIPHADNTCITCGTKLKGNYCWKCGEKKLNPAKDYALYKFIEQTVDGFTHFDSKFLRSFKALLFRPGFLTSEFILGRRTLYMKPVQIFIVASVLFYFVFPTGSTFYSSVSNMRDGNILKYNVNESLQKRADADGISIEAAIKSTNVEAAHRSKAYLFLIIPFWGIAFYFLFFNRIPFLVPHVVFAIHNLAFCILLFLTYLSGFQLFGKGDVNDYEILPLVGIFLIYTFIAIRKVYQQNIFWSAVKCLISLGVFLLLFIVYRQLITAWALSAY